MNALSVRAGKIMINKILSEEAYDVHCKNRRYATVGEGPEGGGESGIVRGSW